MMPDRLRLYAHQFEDQHASQSITVTLREAANEIERLRTVLQRVRRWGSPMVRGYIDAALGRSDRGSGAVADDEDRAMVAQEEKGVSNPDPDHLMIDPPSGWQYDFPKRIPREHLHRATEWMIENGYPRHLTEEQYFPVRYWNATEEK